MIVFVNPRAGAGAGSQRWQRCEPLLRERFGDVIVVMLDSPDALAHGLDASMHSHDPRVVAAGGDGTANAVLHALMRGAPAYAGRCVLGALGLGSSNDFHKPFNSDTTLGGFPARLAFDRTTRCDVGRILFGEDVAGTERHFFLNASAGITADGNCRFNAPGPVLDALKKMSTHAAITYAAVTALVWYKNIPVRLTIPGSRPLSLSLTNIGILKSPFFSGDLHYDVARDHANGRFAVIACEQMDIPQRLHLFHSLLHGTTEGLPGVRSWSTSSLTLEADHPIPIEFDGETMMTRTAQFTVLPHALQVCP